MSDNPLIRKRFQAAENAKTNFTSVYNSVSKLIYVFEKHINVQDDWAQKFRFPELFGDVQRKFDNLVEVLPEYKVKSNDENSLLYQAAIDHQLRISNIAAEKADAYYDAIVYGMGVLHVFTHREEKTIKGKSEIFYDGLAAEKIDPRYFYPAHSAYKMHDATGRNSCPYAFYEKKFNIDTFKTLYADKKYNQEVIEKLQTEGWESNFSSLASTKNEGIEKNQDQDYIGVLEYYNCKTNEFKVFAGNFNHEIYSGELPYSHGEIPFHVFWNYRRNDSIFGLSEVVIRAPYNEYRERMSNLMIENALMSQQRPLIIDENLDFNPEDIELGAGVVHRVGGMVGGRLEDHIQFYPLGQISQESLLVSRMVEDSEIATTGDDKRALQANPQQLATQTLSKRESFQKRIRSAVYQNAVHSEFYLMRQIACLVRNELAEPIVGEQTEYREIKIDNYSVAQDHPSAKVNKIAQNNSVEGTFRLNPEVAKQFKTPEIEIVPVKLDEEIKRDSLEKRILFIQQVFNLAQTPEGQKMIGDLQISEIIKDTAKDLSMDIRNYFPAKSKTVMDTNSGSGSVQNILMGEQLQSNNPYELYESILQFEQTPAYKSLRSAEKNRIQAAKREILSMVQSSGGLTGEPATGQGGIPQSSEGMQQVPSESVGQSVE